MNVDVTIIFIHFNCFCFTMIIAPVLCTVYKIHLKFVNFSFILKTFALTPEITDIS